LPYADDRQDHQPARQTQVDASIVRQDPPQNNEKRNGRERERESDSKRVIPRRRLKSSPVRASPFVKRIAHNERD
jgi:hypothetical protein